MFRNAQHRIIILSSYFLPGTIFRKNMTLAAKKGVVIKVIVGSVSDVKISRLAEKYMYRWLFRNHIEVYEYQHTVLHGKSAHYEAQSITTRPSKVNTYTSLPTP